MFKFSLLSLLLISSSVQAIYSILDDPELGTSSYVTVTTMKNEGLTHVTKLSALDFIEGNMKVTAPHSILAETLYTTDMDVYAYKKYNIKYKQRKFR